MIHTAYIAVPITQKPIKSGWYDLVDTQPRDYKATSGYFHEGRWFEDKETAEGTKEDFGDFDWLEDYTHWLKPLDLASLIGDAWEIGIERFCFDNGSEFVEGTPPNKQEYINSILNP